MAEAWSDIGDSFPEPLPDLGTPTFTARTDGLVITYPGGQVGIVPWSELFVLPPDAWPGVVYAAMHEMRLDAEQDMDEERQLIPESPDAPVQ